MLLQQITNGILVLGVAALFECIESSSVRLETVDTDLENVVDNEEMEDDDDDDDRCDAFFNIDNMDGGNCFELFL